MVAEKEHRVRGRADAAFGGFDQPEPHVTRRILHAIEVTRDAPFRRQNHDGGGVSKLASRLVVGIAEADGVRDRLDGRLRSRQKVPAAVRRALSVEPGVDLVFLGSLLGPVLRVEADGDRLIVCAELEGNSLQGPQLAVQNFGAHERTIEIDQRQDDRLLAEVITEPHRLARLVNESQIRRELADPFAA